MWNVFDPAPEAVFNPKDVARPNPNMPKTVVTCFADNLVEYAAKRYNAKRVCQWFSANGPFPIYEVDFEGTKLGLCMTAVGASAAVGQYEDLFVMGAERMVVFGTCGTLSADIADCGIILPDRAVRDEGTSFHYAPPSEEIDVNVSALGAMRDFFDGIGVKYASGKVWTTDAIYRETARNVAHYRDEGCVCVDMECSALAALAQFRGKTVAQFFYAADHLECDRWDKRSLNNEDGLDRKYAVVELALRLGKYFMEKE